MKTFHCDKCGQLVFFENNLCHSCGSVLGFVPEQLEIRAFAPEADHKWRSLSADQPQGLYRQCQNYSEQKICNWMVAADDPNIFCASCRLTHIIPALSNPKNHLYWHRLETAKRHLLYTLWALHLQPVPKQIDAKHGMAFEFLENLPDAPEIMTGHADGVITLNIAEADAAHRENAKEQMHEPYRTLLGHFRHESGHYYFDRLVKETPLLEKFRGLFGDERQDYGQSLQRYYENGPPSDWNERFISTYAAAHPWEDWAETWAHYLHMVDTLETAHACGVSLKPAQPREPVLEMSDSPIGGGLSFDEMMNNWHALTYVMNSLNRSIGMQDAYPFTLSTPVLEKLRFVHTAVRPDINK